MAKQKVELSKKLSGNGKFNWEDLTLTIGEDGDGGVIDLKDKLKSFDGEVVRFSFVVAEVVAEG